LKAAAFAKLKAFWRR